MGRRGYVQITPPKYGSCVSDWLQESFYYFLCDTKLEVDADNEWAPQCADHWDIIIPGKFAGRGKKRRYVIDYDAVLRVARRLKARPGLVKDNEGTACGEACAYLLEEGAEAAKKHKSGVITIDWM